MARDYIGDARSLSGQLGQLGHGLWESRIDDVIVGGATGTEILMGLRFVLGNLVESGECDGALTDQAAELRRAIDAALS